MAMEKPADLPDERGRFGEFGGKFIPETLMAAVAELDEAYIRAKTDAGFQSRLGHLLSTYAGRPTPLYFAEHLTRQLGGARIYLKREDLAHTGAHKINNALGQALLAQHMGKTRIIAETGAGQHGVASATACAMLGLQCIVYMGKEDIQRQSLNVFRMRLLEAEVVAVESGTQTLKDAINEAIRDWVTNVETTHYLIGSVVGPHPYPMMVRDFQCVIGSESRRQILEAEGRLPDYVTACVGGGSNSIGMFHPFVPDEEVRLIGLEAGGSGAGKRRTLGHADCRTPRRAPRRDELPAAGPERAGQPGPQHIGRAGLSGRRAGAQLPQGLRPGRIPGGDRRPGAGRLPPSLPHRRNHTGAGVGPRRLRLRRNGPPTLARPDNSRLPQRPR